MIGQKERIQKIIFIDGDGDQFHFPNTRLTVDVPAFKHARLNCTMTATVNRRRAQRMQSTANAELFKDVISVDSGTEITWISIETVSWICASDKCAIPELS